MKDITIKIDNVLSEKTNSFGAIAIVSKVNVEISSLLIQKELSSISAEIKLRFSNTEIKKIKSISNIRDIMSMLGRNPDRYLNSIESLLKRLISGKPLYTINSVVDFNNYISLKYLVPIGSYDLDKIDGEIIMRCGNFTDIYSSLSKDDFVLNNLPLLSDKKGAFGSIVSDSKRTLIDTDTKNILTVLFFVEKSKIPEILETIQELFLRFLSAKEINIKVYE